MVVVVAGLFEGEEVLVDSVDAAEVVSVVAGEVPLGGEEVLVEVAEVPVEEEDLEVEVVIKLQTFFSFRRNFKLKIIFNFN